jgi:uncharacterized GH25 family protein
LIPEQKTYVHFEKNEKNENKVHYLSIVTKISTTKHKQHFEIIPNSGPKIVVKW